MPESTYRVYAKIIGDVLPSNEKISLFNCVIKRMSLSEQKQRKFKTIEGEIQHPEDHKSYYKSYITNKRVSDPRFIKTNYIIYTDVKVRDENGALGLATYRFDQVCGALTLTTSSWFNHESKREDLKNYEYQLCRVYVLAQSGQETPIEKIKLYSGQRMTNHPNTTDFSKLDQNLLDRILKCKDIVFTKSLRYLMEAEKGVFLNVPPAMLTISLFKSIENIVCSFKGKTFNKQLEKCAKILDFSEQDIKKIKKFKKFRDHEDVAHSNSRRVSRFLFMPPQFPLPQDVNHPNLEYSGLAGKVVLKYLMYIDSLVVVKIVPKKYEGSHIDTIIDVNNGSYYEISPSVRDRKKIVLLIKKKLSTYFNIPYSSIRLNKYATEQIVFQIKDGMNFKIHKSNSGVKKITIFPF